MEFHDLKAMRKMMVDGITFRLIIVMFESSIVLQLSFSVIGNATNRLYPNKHLLFISKKKNQTRTENDDGSRPPVMTLLYRKLKMPCTRRVVLNSFLTANLNFVP